MSGVRRGAHDLDLEAFGNVTRIGVRDIRGRGLLAVLNLDHTQAVVQYPLAILVADYKPQRCLVRIVELMRLRFFAVVLCDIRRGLDGHVVFPRLIRSRRFRPVERLALRVVDQVVVFRPAAGRADVLYLNLPDSGFQIVIGGSRNKRGFRDFAVANCDGKTRGFLPPNEVIIISGQASTSVAITRCACMVIVIIECQLHCRCAGLCRSIVERQARFVLIFVIAIPAGNGIAEILQDSRVAELDCRRACRIVVGNKFG